MAREELRIRCPLCGMLPYLSYMRDWMAKAQTELRIIRQTVGGRERGEYEMDSRGRYRLQVRGKINYEDVTPQESALLAELATEISAEIEKIQVLLDTIA